MTDTPAAATPPIDLERQIMDSRVPKNEREWWAAREIERLREQIDELRRGLRGCQHHVNAIVDAALPPTT